MVMAGLRRGLIVGTVGVAVSLASASPASATSFVVNSLGDGDDGMCTTDPGGCTLREAIDDANANGSVEADQISFSVTGAIGLSTQLPEITTRTTIAGPGVAALTVYRQSGTLRIFTLNGATAGDTIRIENLTIDNGDAGVLNGGGVYVDVGGINVLDGVIVKRNQAADGGGVFVSFGASLDVLRSTITGNTANDLAQGQGGGINNNGELFVDSSAITDNTASFGLGGGIRSGETGTNAATIVNSTIAGNKAASSGGGVQVTNGGLLLRSDTIVGNTSDLDNSGNEPGGGVNILPTGADVANTILAGNVRGTVAPVPSDCRLGAAMGTAVDSAGYNLRSSADEAPGPGECDPGFNQPGDAIIPAMVTTLGPLADNGGPTPTIALLPGSPAIDAGNPATPSSAVGSYPACPATDQRGLPRGGAAGRCDIGAFEVQPPPPVSPTSPSPTSSPLASPAPRKKCKRKKNRAGKKRRCKRKKRR